MTTDAVRHKMNAIGVDGFVGKTDIELLYNTVKDIIGIKK
jgi:two-component system chemotaxis response regulator CheV